MWLGEDLFDFHPIIGKCLTPGQKYKLNHPEWGEYEIKANSSGFRCQNDFSPSKRVGISRILLFGDSNAFGEGVSHDVGFTGVLEKLLPGIEIYNFAIPGFAVDQQYICYQEISRKFKHDLIVIALTIETIRKITAHYLLVNDKVHGLQCVAKPYFELASGKLIRGHVPLPSEKIDMEKLSETDKAKIYRANTFADVRGLLDKTRPVKKNRKRLYLMDRLNFFLKRVHVQDSITKVRPYPEYDLPNTPAWEITRAILTEWASSSPTPLLIIPLPSFIYVKERADARNYQMRFREIEKDTACYLYDPLPDLLKLPIEERRQLYYLEGHLTPQGHTWMAKKIAPHLKQLLTKKKAMLRFG